MSFPESSKRYRGARQESTDLASSSRRRTHVLDSITNLLKLVKRRPRFERVSIATQAEAAWNDCSTTAGTLEVVHDRELLVDSEWMHLAFTELFRNAIEHSGRPSSVRVRVENDSIYVEDDGPGLPFENPRRALDAGVSTKRHGAGYGLTVVKHVCAAHDCTIGLRDGDIGGLRVKLSYGRP